MNLTNNQLNILADISNTILGGTAISYNANTSPRLIGFNPGRGNGFGVLLTRGLIKLGRVRKDGTSAVNITSRGVKMLASRNVTV